LHAVGDGGGADADFSGARVAQDVGDAFLDDAQDVQRARMD
jgi:hypothetical protein